MYKTQTIILNFILLASTIALLLSTNACSPIYVYPTRQTVAMVEEKGDLVASLNIATGSNINAAAAYSITDNVAVSTQFSSYDQTRFTGEEAIFPDYSWQNELILYKNNPTGITSALNIGLGINQLANRNTYFTVSDRHLFLQPSISIRVINEFSISFSGRFIGTKYNMLPRQAYNNADDIEMMQNIYSFPYDKNTIYYRFDPAITFTSHIDDLKIQFQMLYPMEMNYRTYNYYWPTFGFTFGYKFANLLKNK